MSPQWVVCGRQLWVESGHSDRYRARVGHISESFGPDGGAALALRECLMEPIAACFEAAATLRAAVDAHLAGDKEEAARLIKAADRPDVRNFTESAWGSGSKKRHAFIELLDAPARLLRPDRPVPRMPNRAIKHAVVSRDGYHCRFCGLPVISPAVREMIRRAYPHALSWGPTNALQHAAFQCLWLQFDHVLPNSRGGESTVQNVVITCAQCNFGRMETTLAEARLVDPLSRPTPNKWSGFEVWDGLERFGADPARM